MTLGFDDLAAGMRLAGVVADADVTVVAVEMHGIGSATLTYRTDDGRLGERIIQVDDLAGLAEVAERRWSFDADGAMFRLASEARRMQQAHLADPFAAVDTSNSISIRTRSTPCTTGCSPRSRCGSCWPTTRARARRSCRRY